MERLDLGGDLVVLAESSTVWVTSEAEQERDKDTKCVGCKMCLLLCPMPFSALMPRILDANSIVGSQSFIFHIWFLKTVLGKHLCYLN